ncbi:sigma-54-dependent Fis family transcriptional regulator [Desulfogranum mediterraneum]|uniref:sigma-54-dependent Fis family transcriptional regulator n=1 Tax=Desulfogranum mediterraneum TaxID=160661 RepID=UPI0003F70538|nr:sigma-54-dependent Fis family transcriptional regulator [Desulfogranum mediterraneum]
MNIQVSASEKSLYAHWQAFTHSRERSLPGVREAILQSWHRCLEAGVDPLDSAPHDRIAGDRLAAALKDREQLLGVARPFMADLYDIVRGTGFVVVLSNQEGYILEFFGDPEATATPLTSNFTVGASWQERDAGTNAIGTALEERRPVQITGPEHFCHKHHGLTCSAAPITDPDGQLLGILDISGPYRCAHAHTLGMVVAATKAITAQLRIIKKNNQLAVANKKLVNFFNMVSEGVLILDGHGSITELNPAAEGIFRKTRKELTGTRFQQLLSGESGCSEVTALLACRSPRSELELSLETPQGPSRCLASAEPVLNEEEQRTGSFITLRPIKAVQNLVHRYSGYLASLQFSDIIGESREMQEAIELAKLSAQSSSNVLLQGESGTGKEIFAQAIHNQSSRRAAPFIPLNCGAIPRELVGSELFGYEDGAFTGASKGGKPGKFELASGGTLFLDEIGDMPLEHQAVLLRVIQEKTMTRIGGLKVIPVDVRLICATHKNLLEKVRSGTFRQDLYYRLNVMSITIPPLRERTADIPQLFSHFIEKLSRDRGTRLSIDHDLMHYLYTYPWPGNVRELQNVAERAANLAINGVVGSNQLPGEVTHQRVQTEPSPMMPSLQSSRHQLRKQRQEREKQQLLQLLNLHYGNVSRVARELGVSRKTIYNRMHRHDIAN